jgi:hypothetical protein
MALMTLMTLIPGSDNDFYHRATQMNTDGSLCISASLRLCVFTYLPVFGMSRSAQTPQTVRVCRAGLQHRQHTGFQSHRPDGTGCDRFSHALQTPEIPKKSLRA